MIIRPEAPLPHPGGHGVYLLPRRNNLRLLSAAQLRQAEAHAYAQMPSYTLMARAGEAAWHWAQQHCLGDNRPWLILAGTGNNGGDAFVLARHAHLAGIPVTVLATGESGPHAADALRARAELAACGVIIGESATLTQIDAGAWACVVDGLLGIGARNPPAGETARLIRLINAARHPRTFALDIPSGLDADTGAAATPCVQASHTLSFIAAKPGLFTADGPDRCADTCVATLGLDAGMALEQWHAPEHTNECLAAAADIGHAEAGEASGKARQGTPPALALSDDAVLSFWPRRRLNSHKGSHGDVVVLGGDSGMSGAAILAGRAAVQMGAGRVFLGLLDGPHPPGYDPGAPEMMLRPAESLASHGGVWVIGPGAGQSDRMQVLLRQLLRHWHDTPEVMPTALVLDADALNLIAADPALAVRLQSLNTLRVITPHPLEASRLLARSVAAVQADRMSAAMSLSKQLDAVVVLKGMGTVVSSEYLAAINLSGGPALASGGTGDVLAGALGAMLAQMLGNSKPAEHAAARGIDCDAKDHAPHPTAALQAAWQAAMLTAYLHGATCDRLPGEDAPPVLLSASDLCLRMRAVLSAVLSRKAANL